MDKRQFYSIVKPRGDWSFSHLSRAETKEITHSYHQYPAKFIPQLARELIENYTDEGELLWDPFCGSGSLNVEAFRSNRPSIGTDINPIAVLISRVKTTPLDPRELSSYRDELLETINSSIIRDKIFYISNGVLDGNVSLLDKWFSDNNLRELAHILWCIDKKRTPKYFGFMLCAFSAILKKSSYWLNSSVKSQIDPDKKPDSPIVYFERQLRAMEKANNLFYLENSSNKTRVRIFKHDAKHRLPSRITEVDCIITSPPYLVSYDYSDIFRLSTYTLFPQADYSKFRKAFVGTPLKRPRTGRSSLLAFIEPTINSIRETGIRRTVNEYYRDIAAYFDNAKYHLKNDGNLIMVVGDTKLRGVEITNAYFLAEIATRTGWFLEEAYTRDIPVKILPTLRDVDTGRFTNRANGNWSERYSREYILVFKKDARK
jgi:DNA modification methylase